MLVLYQFKNIKNARHVQYFHGIKYFKNIYLIKNTR